MKKYCLLLLLLIGLYHTSSAQSDTDTISNAALKNYAIYLNQQWKNVPTPLIATYRGNDFGDYFHIEFEDADGNFYDFGYGANNLKKVALYADNEQFDDNPEYLNKTFLIFWDWRLTTFPCCEGAYNSYTLELPSIIRLQLIKE
ncbi:MAG: hypothetical protein ACPG4Z_08645 [Chitinophagales bacterium]